jgi:flagellar basal body-associated protein FliL
MKKNKNSKKRENLKRLKLERRKALRKKITIIIIVVALFTTVAVYLFAGLAKTKAVTLPASTAKVATYSNNF